jgi:hypothetical protein
LKRDGWLAAAVLYMAGMMLIGLMLFVYFIFISR